MKFQNSLKIEILLKNAWDRSMMEITFKAFCSPTFWDDRKHLRAIFPCLNGARKSGILKIRKISRARPRAMARTPVDAEKFF